MEKHTVIAIDGPAGSGKSTVAKLIAGRLNFVYIDTGAMYRALTLKAMREKIDLEDAAALTELARATKIDLAHDAGLKVFLDGEDVTGLIRTPELTNNVKHVAGVAGVRSEMVKLQQAIGRRRSSVLEGRDIGTVVFPDAQYKFYLDAHIEERTKRRHKELLESGMHVTLDAMKQDIETRDTSDIERKVGALKKAEDAVVVDTTHLTIDEVVEKLLSHIRP
ncbi:MAG: (d)CMP kinase [Candidatus Omnitrophica bacterium]|nr:(d)CMP kinase [Candidatus Omnitrophota bacterium]